MPTTVKVKKSSLRFDTIDLRGFNMYFCCRLWSLVGFKIVPAVVPYVERKEYISKRVDRICVINKRDVATFLHPKFYKNEHPKPPQSPCLFAHWEKIIKVPIQITQREKQQSKETNPNKNTKKHHCRRSIAISKCPKRTIYIFANNPYCYSQDVRGDHEHHHRPFHVMNPNSYLAVREFFESTIALSSSSWLNCFDLLRRLNLLPFSFSFSFLNIHILLYAYDTILWVFNIVFKYDLNICPKSLYQSTISIFGAGWYLG